MVYTVCELDFFKNNCVVFVLVGLDVDVFSPREKPLRPFTVPSVCNKTGVWWTRSDCSVACRGV